MKILTGSSESGEVNVEPTNVDEKVRYWLEEIADARKREKEWRRDAKELVELYEVESPGENEFNILYSNTETLLPALYNNTPRPEVRRRYKDADPTGAAVSKLTERMLAFMLDPGTMDKSPFDQLMESAVLDALVPGRGVTRFKYEADIEEAQEEADGEDEDGEAVEPVVKSETVSGEEIPYERILFGYARRWKDVPWLAIEHFLTREEAIETLGEEIGKAIPLTVGSKEDEGADEDMTKPQNAEGVKFAHLYEIWDKAEKQVVFVSPGWKSGYAKPPVDDPLGLQGFFPIPQPLQFTTKISSLLPTPLYKFYEQQAKELNRVTMRINKLTNALKVRGFYDSSIEGLDKIMESEDNSLIPAENISALAQGRGLDQSIWLMPIKDLIQVLQELYLQRTQVKQVIYEITGISDILRGSSAASETATAQNIKNQWGTLRLKRMQKRVMLYVRNCLRIMAEIAGGKFSKETMEAMTGLRYPTAEEQAQARGMLQQMQQQAQMQQAQMQPGQPSPPAPQPPPELLKIANTPTWDDIINLMREDLSRSYRIDIETNSTVDAEATEDKQLVGEFLNAVAQFMHGIAPMVQQGILPFEASKSMLLAAIRRYRFGDEVEEQIMAMKPPEQKPDPAAEKSKMEAQALQQQMQFEQQRQQLDLQLQQQEAQIKAAGMQQEMALKQQEAELKAKELQLKLVELDRKAQYQAAAHAQKMQQLAMQAAVAQTKETSNANV